MFSLGVLLYVLKMRNYPWSMATPKDNYYRVHALNKPYLFWRAQQSPCEDERFKDLLNNLWKPKFEERFDIDAAL